MGQRHSSRNYITGSSTSIGSDTKPQRNSKRISKSSTTRRYSSGNDNDNDCNDIMDQLSLKSPRKRKSLLQKLSRIKSAKSLPQGVDLGILLVATGDSGKTTWMRQCQRYFIPRDSQSQTGSSSSSSRRADASDPQLSPLFDTQHLACIMYEHLIRGSVLIFQHIIEHKIDDECKRLRPQHSDIIDDQREIMCEILRMHQEYVERDNSHALLLNYRDWAIREMAIMDLLDELWNGVADDESVLRFAMDAPHNVHLVINDFFESFEYWLNNIGRMLHVTSFVPTDEDIVRVKVKTTGIVQCDKFVVRANLDDNHLSTFSIVDVGGRRNERRKWPHIFRHGQIRIDAVIFFASLSEFNQTLYEDDKINRLHESLDLFAKVVNSDVDLCDSQMYIVFTKYDVFLDKVRRGISPLDALHKYGGAEHTHVFDSPVADKQQQVNMQSVPCSTVTKGPCVEIRKSPFGDLHITNQYRGTNETEEELAMRDRIIIKYLEQIHDRDKRNAMARGGKIFVLAAVDGEAVQSTMKRITQSELNNV